MLKKLLLGTGVIALIFAIYYLAINSMGVTPLNPSAGLLLGLIAGMLIGMFVSNTASVNVAASRPSESKKQTIYVGNLPFRTTRYELRELFQPYGKIHSARIVIDKATRKPRGYAFVEMDSKGAAKAIHSLNGFDFAGRNLKVSTASNRN